ncbi:MAG: T9SS type A sorting domain-containing protein [Bacteroidetes bacterium]|nr:MAG: T9SS type A sorting domain-containing protein [Bacteroidota bacterium]
MTVINKIVACFGVALLGVLQVQAQMYGAADSAFGTNGMKSVDFGSKTDQCRSSVLDNQGRIWLGGYTEGNVSINSSFTRLDTLGGLTPGFKDNGIGVLDFDPNGNEGVFCMAVDQSNRVYGVSLIDGAVSGDVLVFRMNLEGVLDTNFGKNGYLTHEVSSADDFPHSMLIDENNRPVIMGYSELATDDLFVLRLLENGDRDSSFSADGVAFFDPLNLDNSPAGIAIRPTAMGGGYYIGSYQNQGGSKVASITSVSKNGNLNIDLGGPGMAHFRKSGWSTTSQDIVMIGSHLYIGGTYRGSNDNQDAFISCIGLDGKLNVDYGDSGSVVIINTPANLDHEAFYKLKVASDSSIYAAGIAQINGDYLILTAHIDPSGSKVGLFGNKGGFHITALLNGSTSFSVTGMAIDDVRGRLFVTGAFEINSEIDAYAYAFKTKATTPAGPNAVQMLVKRLTVYPNPSRGSVNLPEMEHGELGVYASNGQYMGMFEIENGQVSLPSSLRSGVYFLRVTDGNTVYTAKLNLIK